MKLAVDTLEDRHSTAKKVIVQSDNASGFFSQEIILFILNMNTRLDDDLFLLSKWIFTEAQTGITQLNTH